MAVADGLGGRTFRGMEITLTVVLSSGGRRPRWLTLLANTGAGRLRSGWLREITDERTISDFVVGACCPRRCHCGAWMASKNVG